MRGTLERNEWRSYFGGFSRQNVGKFISIDVASGDVSADGAGRSRHAVLAAPLIGISAEVRQDLEPVIEIAVGEGMHLTTHVVHHPTRVEVEQIENGADDLLRIESATDPTTLVDLRRLSGPNVVDVG